MNIAIGLFFLFLALGIVLFSKYMLFPYLHRRYLMWKIVRKLRKVMSGKSEALKNDISDIINGAVRASKEDKM